MKKKVWIIAVIAVVLSFGAGILAKTVYENYKEKSRPNITAEYKGEKGKTASGVNVVENGKPDKPAQHTSKPDEGKCIGEENAKQIALEKAGLSEDEVKFVKVKLERDDGVYIYEIEFYKGYTEYSAEIKADDGKILEWDVDIDD